MPNFMISIKQEVDRVVFDPSPLKDARRGDKISWKNDDAEEAHWPAKKEGTDTSLMINEIPPGGSSESDYEIEEGIDVIEVRCAVEGHTEEGRIEVG